LSDRAVPKTEPNDAGSLREAELLARILEVVPGGIVQVAADGAIVRANLQAQQILGLSWDVLTARYVTDFASETFREDGSACPPSDYPIVQCLTSGEPAGPTTIGVRQPSGEVRWAIFSALPFPDSSNGKLGAVVTFVDITERRRGELTARALDRLLDSVRLMHAQSAKEASETAFHEPLSIVLELTNSAMGFIASFEPADAPEQLELHARIDERRLAPSSARVPIDPISREAIASGTAQRRTRPGRAGGAFLDREPGAVLVLPLRSAERTVGVLALADAPGGYSDSLIEQLAPLLAACADLASAFAERRARARLEAQLAQAERLASVGTLAAGIAHEVNNPLAYVLLNLEGVVRHAKTASAAVTDREEAARVLARLMQNATDALEGAERVQTIVRDLTTFSRVTEEEKRLVAVNEAIVVALKMADHEIKYRARLSRELGDLDPVLGNDGRLSQVFLNLLLNAARAIEEGRPEQNEVRVRSWMEGEDVLVEVADTGHGVAPEHLHRLFEPFFSTRAPGAGAGLGLSICHNVVHDHGGRIDVTSTVGVGTRFVVRLPRAPRTTESARPKAPISVAPRAAKRARILVVDDEPMVLRALTAVLSRKHDVVTAEGVAAAMGQLSDGEPFSAVLCDMMMLDGTGMDVYAWVAEHKPALAKHMIFMTGGTFTPKARAFLSSVAAPHVTKPFSLRDLDEMILNMLE
jgi:PAS domain S-box-containing protein